MPWRDVSATGRFVLCTLGPGGFPARGLYFLPFFPFPHHCIPESPYNMSLQTSTEAIRTKVGADSGLGASVKFVLEDGVIYVDGKSTPNSVSNDNKDADCTVNISLADLQSMLAGQLQPTTAFMTGKLKVSGDMSVALKLQRVV